MRYQREAFRTLYRLISERQLSEKEALSIAKSIFWPSVIEVPQATDNNTQTSPENDSVSVRGFQPEQ